ncbi:MAG: D-alanine--poly(phosphoribitol) ligase subunit DltA [Coriobacteriales bacterium]|jgi:D-alanine--poly(phosphoribitol) ligase subunit 1|nr:D-alanine--poly(phosphoribitol) ligase subunit DltA [Coriobacteriales bacterium]
MRYLISIRRWVQETPQAIAFRNTDGASLSYGELWQRATSLASQLSAADAAGTPVVVYGHKEPLMIACFLACSMSGRAYIPVDSSLPVERLQAIVDQIKEPLLLAVRQPEVEIANARSVERKVLEQWASAKPAPPVAADGPYPSDTSAWVSDEELFYILFTSGSSGVPKGVEVTAACVDNFLEWALTLGDVPKEGKTFINQAPFSFDLSVFELTMALASGGCLFSLCSETQHSLPKLFLALADSQAHIWVSTPSFAALCLNDASFTQELLPEVELFLFCGEVLLPSTAAGLHERFPRARVVNTYGPTESTVAVTQVPITPEHCASGVPLPVGRARSGTRIDILGTQGEVLLPGETGEIRIVGDTVARGYFGQPELSAQVFGRAETLMGENDRPVAVRSYRTGDKGYLDKTGMLYYQGRLDFQVKLNGYRIELGDIEENLRALPYVKDAAVLPALKDEKITHLVAYVALSTEIAPSSLKARMRVKEDLSKRLPAYMVPKSIVLMDNLPLNPNGKVDRSALRGSVQPR